MSSCTKQLINTHLCNTQYNCTQQLHCSHVQSFLPKRHYKTVSVGRKWLLILKHGKEIAFPIMCACRTLSKTKQRRLVKKLFASSCWLGYTYNQHYKNSWSVHIYLADKLYNCRQQMYNQKMCIKIQILIEVYQ